MTRQFISTFRQPPLHYLTRSVRRTSGFVLADYPGATRKTSNPPLIHVELGLINLHRGKLDFCRKAVSMAKPAPITIPTEPISSIPRPIDLIERVVKSDSEDPSLAPLYEDEILDTIEQFEATGSPVVTDGEQRSIIISVRTACMGFRTRPGWFQNRVLRSSHAPPVAG